MKILLVLTLAAVAYAKHIVPLESDKSTLEPISVYGYIQNYAIPLAEEIRKAEEEISQGRIAGGSPSTTGQFPYQLNLDPQAYGSSSLLRGRPLFSSGHLSAANEGTQTHYVVIVAIPYWVGLLADYHGITGIGICGGSLASSNRVITAAHCWFDGWDQAWRFTVVLGSVLLFSGGTRVQTSSVFMHPNFSAMPISNDVAVIHLPQNIAFSDTISPIALPSGNELTMDYAGATAVASGFGLTGDGASITLNQFLSHVTLNVITNTECIRSYPWSLQASNICTSGAGGTSTCRGDSGGPLVFTSNNRRILIGINSFGSGLGCQAGMPAAFARVTSYISFFNQHNIS